MVHQKTTQARYLKNPQPAAANMLPTLTQQELARLPKHRGKQRPSPARFLATNPQNQPTKPIQSKSKCQLKPTTFGESNYFQHFKRALQTTNWLTDPGFCGLPKHMQLTGLCRFLSVTISLVMVSPLFQSIFCFLKCYIFLESIEICRVYGVKSRKFEVPGPSLQFGPLFHVGLCIWKICYSQQQQLLCSQRTGTTILLCC